MLFRGFADPSWHFETGFATAVSAATPLLDRPYRGSIDPAADSVNFLGLWSRAASTSTYEVIRGDQGSMYKAICRALMSRTNWVL